MQAKGENEYYEQVLGVISTLDEPKIRVRKIEGMKWFEIDDICDLDIVQTLFAPDGNMNIQKLQKSYGGYWRYPGLLDFCYPVNPYFPPESLKKELAGFTSVLLTSYPSGVQTNSLLCNTIFDIREENLTVGNGAAEIIRNLMMYFEGKTGIVRPGFEEYPNRLRKEDLVVFIPQNRDYTYTADDLICYFDKTDICNLIIVNPDNPSGNYILKRDLLRLCRWSEKKNISLVIDESFVDFADEENATLISGEILSEFPMLYVIKSLSKSHGIPGLRLGILASGDRMTVEYMKKDASIWNINSFAEFYMQIERKYTEQYKASLNEVRKERKNLESKLGKIPGIRVCSSQANYIMVEVQKMSSAELTKCLLQKHHIFVKDLSEKMNNGNYLRIAVRNENDNATLIEALTDCLTL